MREMKAKVEDQCKIESWRHETANSGMSADDKQSYWQKGKRCCRDVDGSDGVCKRRKLRVNVGKSKVIYIIHIKVEM